VLDFRFSEEQPAFRHRVREVPIGHHAAGIDTFR
jgi:hypothetical protein